MRILKLKCSEISLSDQQQHVVISWMLKMSVLQSPLSYGKGEKFVFNSLLKTTLS